jgi:3-methylcrotonyl-CoA carboxylase alpha subunit
MSKINHTHTSADKMKANANSANISSANISRATISKSDSSSDKASIKKVLIANRGEIAARIIHTLKRLNIRSVALFAEADQHSPYVYLADEAFFLEGKTTQETYLNIDRILTIAQQTQADAVHPGYGFLSENAAFAAQCEAVNLIFIGPSAAAIAAMGSKAEAKSLMEKANVPIIPGYHGLDQHQDQLLKEAQLIGFPLLIKAAAGGGGKGMRLIESAELLLDGLQSARSEAIKFFGDDRLILERYVKASRHIEVQILSDQQGIHRHLYERDCSIQRRHQKIIEEAPANLLSEPVKQALYQAATQAAAAINYVGAGTIEFLYDIERNEFYFMEMNTRLQVEHPVTELITGLDLVEWQIKIANGDSLSELADPLPIHGHAIEARIYAEDPLNNFLPASGLIRSLSWPEVHPKLRIYSSIAENTEVGVAFDPMIAKVVSFGQSREEAANRLATALRATHLSGIPSNLTYLANILTNPDFLSDRYDTGYVAEHPQLLESLTLSNTALLAVAPLLVEINKSQAITQHPWDQLCAWQLNAAPKLYMSLHTDDGPDLYIQGSAQSQSHWEFTMTAIEHMGNKASVIVRLNILHWQQQNQQTQTYPVQDQSYSLPKRPVNSEHFAVKVLLDNQIQTLNITAHNNRYWVTQSTGTVAFTRFNHQPARDQSGSDLLTAPMNGTLIDVRVKENESVKPNQVLLVLEAMKMEHPIKAPAAGRVSKVLYQVGDQVKAGAEMIQLDVEEA